LRDRLIFALDVADTQQALALVDELGDAVSFYKLGLEIFLSGDYYPLVTELQRRDKKIFADLKLFDVPATVAAAVRQLAGPRWLQQCGNWPLAASSSAPCTARTRCWLQRQKLPTACRFSP